MNFKPIFHRWNAPVGNNLTVGFELKPCANSFRQLRFVFRVYRHQYQWGYVSDHHKQGYRILNFGPLSLGIVLAD